MWAAPSTSEAAHMGRTADPLDLPAAPEGR